MSIIRTESKRKVLVIEDNEINREILTDMLSEYYTVLQAENGQQGLDVLESYGRKISLILLDIQMPVMNGYDFLRAIRQRPHFSAIPIIVTTSADSISDEVLCLEIGASDFVTKPYNPDIILKRIESMIRLSESSAMLNKIEYDALTSLYSREFFYNRAEMLLEANSDIDFDIVCCEIESLDLISGRYDIEQWNAMLKYISEHLIKSFSPSVLGGILERNVFAFLCPHIDYSLHQDFASKFVESLRGAPIPNVTLQFGVYCGVCHNLPVPVMCDYARLALSGIKRHYGVYIAEYDDALRLKLQREQTMRKDMETALAEHQFQVYYQPKYDLTLRETRGAEALVRWFHPKMGFMSPAEFIPLFELNGFITKLDTYVFDEVCRAQRRWLDAGLRPLPVSVNISRVDFEHDELPDLIRNAVASAGIPRDCLHLEVTESAHANNPERVVSVVRELKEDGFCIELDDFGTGYSSLNTLSELMPDVLKLDMSIVKSLDSATQQTIVGHILSLAHDLDMETVGEGVETQEQAEVLRSIGCTYAQGYLYSKPVPEDQFLAYLACEASSASV